MTAATMLLVMRPASCQPAIRRTRGRALAHATIIGLLTLANAAPLRAQRTMAVGDTVRVRLTPASDGVRRARIDDMTADSITLTLDGADVRLRARRGELPLERALGRQRARGAMIGAITGASAMALTFLAGTRGEELGLGALIVPIVAIGGGVAGAGIGAAAAPVRWVPVEATSTPCPAWRIAPGSIVAVRTGDGLQRGRVAADDGSFMTLQSPETPSTTLTIRTDSATLDLPGGRARARSALIGAGAGLLLGVIGSATDPDVSAGSGVAITLGNAAAGAGIGALLGPRRQSRIGLSCRAQ